jgi:large subunit ribosomal protein L17
MRNLANQLIVHKEIKTTTAKAKEARPTVERLITYAKKGDLHHRRLAFRFLRQKSAIKTLFDEIAPAFSDRQGGYTRVIKLGRRQGDGASMSMLQLVGFETLADTAKTEKKKKSKKKETKVVDQEAQEEVTETVPEEKAPIETEKAKPEAEPEAEKKDTTEKEDKKE